MGVLSKLSATLCGTNQKGTKVMPLHALIIAENGETDAIIESMMSRKPDMSAEDILEALNCQPE